MIGVIGRRFFHTCNATLAARSSALAKLRKSTGYTVSNCKKALEMFPDDIPKAEEWLHAEAKSKGWSKWAKVQSRTAAQGLIGVCTQGNVGVMVEVNCETDFVARNEEFQLFVEKMISGCMNYAENLNVDSDFTKSVLEASQLSSLKCEASNLGELLVAATCKFGEKTVAKRAVCLKVNEDILLKCLSHPVTECSNLKGSSLGKYGVLLALKRSKIEVDDDVNSLGYDICQHIIGMNPLSIGELTEKDIEKFTAKKESVEDIVTVESSESELDSQKDKTEDVEGSHTEGQDVEGSHTEGQDVEGSHTEGQEDVDTTLKESDEVQLLFQPYLLGSDVTTGELLFKSGLEVLAFERFECGESVNETAEPPEPKVAQSAGA